MANENYAVARSLMMNDLHRVMRRTPSGSLREQREWLTSAVHDLLIVHGAQFAAIAADELEFTRMGRGQMNLPTVIATAVGVEQVGASVGWALSMDDFTTALSGAVLRHGQNQGRRTVVESATAAGNGFARVVASDACPWCLMLASRGAVYESEESASKAGMGRVRAGAKQHPGESFHDHCKCEVVEVRSPADLPGFNLELQDKWREATGDARGDLFKAWRDYLKENPITAPVAA